MITTYTVEIYNSDTRRYRIAKLRNGNPAKGLKFQRACDVMIQNDESVRRLKRSNGTVVCKRPAVKKVEPKARVCNVDH